MNMPFDGSVRLENFRSLSGGVDIPFSKNITLITGPNNVGKSNVLKALAILWNKSSQNLIDELYDFPSSDKSIRVTLKPTVEYLRSRLARRPNAEIIYSHAGRPSIEFPLKLSKGSFELGYSKEFAELFQGYSSNASRHYITDFSQSNGTEQNLRILLEDIHPYPDFPGTVFLPNLRFITPPGKVPDRFVNVDFPGDVVSFGTVVDQLASMDRPSYDQMHLKETLSRIGDFMAFCLECRTVQIEVPTGKKTIHLRINGEERPISSLGTGVEQLLMIGLASVGFDEKLVLIDEPELHLHPRSQKLIVRYLAENSTARYVISTHSAAILDAVDADVIHITRGPQGVESRTITSNRDRYRAIRDLGHSASELLHTRYAIWVEGPSDRIYLKHWISLIAGDLIEGVDYTILFYGGKVLSHHAFTDGENELVKAVSLSRDFAVVMDSDRSLERPNLNSTKRRVAKEVEAQGGISWITEGREIENYVPDHVIRAVSLQKKGISVPSNKRAQVLDSTLVKKTEFAYLATAIPTNEWPLDLKRRITELVTAIRAAK